MSERECVREREMMARCCTQLTGAMVAQTCGAHQGAEVMLAWFEVSRDLQSANEERDKEDKVRQQ